MGLNIITQGQTGETTLVLTAKLIINNDQIKALPTTPLEVIPTPGAGKIIWVNNVIFKSDILVAGDYQDSAGQVLTDDSEIKITWGLNQVNAAKPISAAACLSPSDNGSYYAQGGSENYIGETTRQLISDWMWNKPICLASNSIDFENYTGGHPDNRFSVHIIYSIIDL